MPSLRSSLSFAAGAIFGKRKAEGSLPRNNKQPEHEQVAGIPWDDIKFEEYLRFRPFDLLPAAGLFFSGDGLSAHSGEKIPHEDLAAPFVSVELTPDLTSAGWTAGLEALTTRIAATYDPSAGEVRIAARYRDDDVILANRPCTFPPGTSCTVTITENVVTVWTLHAATWRAVLTHRLDPELGIDLRKKDQLSEYRLFYRGVFNQVRAGYFGYVGLRDPQLIRKVDGEAVAAGSRKYFTATCAGPGFFQTAHWGVFSIDLHDPGSICLESLLFFQRDGLLLGDHAGFVIQESPGSYLIGVSSWGDFDRNVHIRRCRAKDDVLVGVHSLPSSRWAVPTTAASWDPSLFRHAGVWWLSFVECLKYEPRFVFRPVLAKAGFGAPWHSVLDRVGADTVHEQTEGTLLTPLRDHLYLLASDGDARDYPIYDLSMDRIGSLSAPYGSNIPHPLIMESNEDFIMLTFDGTDYNETELGYGTHGDILIYRSAKAET